MWILDRSLVELLLLKLKEQQQWQWQWQTFHLQIKGNQAWSFCQNPAPLLRFGPGQHGWHPLAGNEDILNSTKTRTTSKNKQAETKCQHLPLPSIFLFSFLYQGSCFIFVSRLGH